MARCVWAGLFGLILVATPVLPADPPAPEKKEPPALENQPTTPEKKDRPLLENEPSNPPKKDDSTPKSPGTTAPPLDRNLPGAFHPFNVTGPRKGNYHCLVSEHGLGSAVMIIVREMEFSDALKDLLKKLDNAVEKNPNVRLGAYVIFVPNDLDDVVTDDDKREIEAGKIEDLGKSLMLKHVILALTHKGDLEKYKLDDGADYTVLLYHKFFIQASESLEKTKLTAAKVDAIIKALGDKLGATRK